MPVPSTVVAPPQIVASSQVLSDSDATHTNDDLERIPDTSGEHLTYYVQVHMNPRIILQQGRHK